MQEVIQTFKAVLCEGRRPLAYRVQGVPVVQWTLVLSVLRG